MHKGKEAIMAWLDRYGYASESCVGKFIQIETEGDKIVLIANMRDAIEFVRKQNKLSS